MKTGSLIIGSACKNQVQESSSEVGQIMSPIISTSTWEQWLSPALKNSTWSRKHDGCQNQLNIFCIPAILLGTVHLIFDLIRPAWYELSCDKQEWLFFATPYFSLFATAYFSARLVARLQVAIGGGQGSTARGGGGGRRQTSSSSFLVLLLLCTTWESRR